VASPTVLPGGVSGKPPIRHSTTMRYVLTRRQRRSRMPMGGIELGAVAVAYARASGLELDANANKDHRHHTKAADRVERGLPETLREAQVKCAPISLLAVQKPADKARASGTKTPATR
jgi:hypothetical protein